MNLSTFFETSIANWISGTVMPAAPVTLTVALSTADPTDDGTGLAEPVGGYTRQPITFAAPTTSAGITSISSTIATVFGPAAAPWGTITHVAIFSNAGDMLFHGAIPAAKLVQAGDTFSIAPGNVVAYFKDRFSDFLSTALTAWVNGAAMPAPPITVDLALSTAAIGSDGAGLSEPPGPSSYARVPVTFGVSSSQTGVGTTKANTNSMVFGPASVIWPPVAFAGLYSGADLLIHGPMASSRTADIGDAIPFAPGSISLLVR